MKFGTIHGKPIIWLVADKNHAGYPSNSVTLVTNQIIKMLCFDAKESANSNRDRRSYGNNRYIYSNLRQLDASGSTARPLPARGTPHSTPLMQRLPPATSGTATTPTTASPAS